MTFPIAFDPSHRFASGQTDPPFTMWTMAWEAHQLETEPLNLYNANIFSPERSTVAYSSLNLAPMLVEYPILRASGNPILAYNFVYLFAWWLVGFAVFLLARHFRLGVTASLASGALAEFSSFSFSQIGHLELLWFGWIPLFFLAAFVFLKRGSRASLFIALIFFWLASLATWYLAIYLLLTASALMLYALRFGRGKRVLAFGSIILIACILLAPFAMPYLELKTGFEKSRTLDQAENYSAHLDSFLHVSHANRVWQGILQPAKHGEADLFPGIAFSVLAALGIRKFWRQGPDARFWVCLSAVSFALMFGPILRLADGASVPLPEYILRFIPGYSLTRVPSRWGLYSTIGFALSAGMGVQLMVQKNQAIAVALVLTALVESFSAPLPTSTLPTAEALEPEYNWLATQPPTTIVELPIQNYGESQELTIGYLYRSIFHQHTLVNGYADYVPEWYAPLADAGAFFPSDSSIELFKAHGAQFAVVHTDKFSLPGNISLIPVKQFEHAIIYRLPATSHQP